MLQQLWQPVDNQLEGVSGGGTHGFQKPLQMGAFAEPRDNGLLSTISAPMPTSVPRIPTCAPSVTSVPRGAVGVLSWLSVFTVPSFSSAAWGLLLIPVTTGSSVAFILSFSSLLMAPSYSSIPSFLIPPPNSFTRPPFLAMFPNEDDDRKVCP